LWLREHNIDIKVIEVELYREGNSLFVQPQTIIPVPVSRFADTGKAKRGDVTQPWISEGRAWHLEKRCNPETREMLEKLDDIITDKFEVDGPNWNQKFYLTYKVNNFNWLIVITGAKVLRLRFTVKAGF
jgi:hypothetical protein